MKQKIEYLKNYLDNLTADTGWQIIIEDHYGILRQFESIRDYLSDKNWHDNPYCLAIKGNPRLWKRCVALKRATRRNIRNRGKAGWSVCYCGVAEYAFPVFSGGVHIATICSAGFLHPLSDRMTEILSRRTGLGSEEFSKVRNESLRELTEDVEQKLNAYLSMIVEFIEVLAEDNPLLKTEGAGEGHDEKQIYVMKAIDHIEKHYCEDISPESVAKRCHISLSYLQHLFLTYTGEGVASRIRRRRLEEACRLLAETGRSVRDIAFSCGFYDTDYFSVIFKRSYGVSPLAFRRGHSNR